MSSHKNSPSQHKNIQLASRKDDQYCQRLEYHHPSISSSHSPQTTNHKGTTLDSELEAITSTYKSIMQKKKNFSNFD
jgi:hypothetical protein